MSFISVVAMENFISVVSDGRAVNSEKNVIVSENYKKVKVFNNSQFVGCTGNAGAANFIFNQFSEGVHYDLEQCAKELFEFINSESNKNVSILVVLGGINKNGEVEFLNFSNRENSKLKHLKPKGTDLNYTFLHSDEISKSDINLDQTFQKMYSSTNIKQVEDVIKLQVNINNLVADKDRSVNKNTSNQLFVKK